MQLNSKLAVLQNKLELLGSNSDSDLLESYKQQNERLQMELDEVRSEHKNVSKKKTTRTTSVMSTARLWCPKWTKASSLLFFCAENFL